MFMFQQIEGAYSFMVAAAKYYNHVKHYLLSCLGVKFTVMCVIKETFPVYS